MHIAAITLLGIHVKEDLKPHERDKSVWASLLCVHHLPCPLPLHPFSIPDLLSLVSAYTFSYLGMDSPIFPTVKHPHVDYPPNLHVHLLSRHLPQLLCPPQPENNVLDFYHLAFLLPRRGGDFDRVRVARGFAVGGFGCCLSGRCSVSTSSSSSKLFLEAMRR